MDTLTGGPTPLTEGLHQAALHDRALVIGAANLADLIVGGSLAGVAGSRAARLMFRPPSYGSEHSRSWAISSEMRSFISAGSSSRS